MIVEVRPIEQNKWHGKKGKESFTQSKTIEVLYDVVSGKYATGMTPEEAELYGKKTGLDLSDQFIPEHEHPYWSTKAAQIRLENTTVFFDTSRNIDYIKVKNMKASKFVANSQKEYEAGLWPDATHVIYDESEEVSLKATKIQKRRKCYAIAIKMSQAEKANIVLILSDKIVKDRSADLVDVELDHIIEEKPDEFIKYADMDSQETYIRASILEGIQKNILTKEGSSIYYMSERIGFDFNEAVEWFSNPDNAKLKVTILEKLTA